MNDNNKTATPTREIQISEWITHERNTCRGFFTATLPSGMILRDLSLHEKDNARWINAPSRPWTGARGDTQYTPIIAFVDRAAADRFRDAILPVLDRHLAEIKARRKP